MRSRQAEAYVLRSMRLGEADLLVTLFTREEGKLRGVARGALRSRKRFGGGLEPLTQVRVRFVEREGHELARLEGTEVLRSFFTIQAEPSVAAACAYVAEVVDQFGREKEADERYFRLVGAVLSGLQEGVDPLLAARYFELWTLRLQGLLPDLRNCPTCGAALSPGARLDLRTGELGCLRCIAGPPEAPVLSRAARVLAEEMLREPLAALAGRHPTPEVASLGRVLAAVLARFVEQPFRSRKILEDLTR